MKSVTLSQTPSGGYYASCLFEDGKEKPEQSADGKAVGIDLGLNEFAITSDGTKHGSPKYYRKYERK
ncbi:transposase, partial [Bacillus sp. SIMBA_161]